MDFTPQQKYSLLSKMGYSGSMQGDEMDAFLQSNPGAAAKMGKFDRAMKRGFQTGGVVQGGVQTPGGLSSPTSGVREEYATAIGDLASAEQAFVEEPTEGAEDYEEKLAKYNEYQQKLSSNEVQPLESAQEKFLKAQQDLQIAQTQDKALTPSPRELTTQAIADPSTLLTQADPSQMAATPEQTIDPSAGVAQGEAATAPTATAGDAALAQAPTVAPAASMEASTVSPQVGQVVGGMEAVQGQVTPESMVEAAQETESSVSQLQAAQGEAFMMENPVQRQIEEGELISGSAVDATKVEKVNSQLQAAQASPSDKATVQGQLEGLMQQFEGGETPAWAAGAMRNAQGILAQRGLGASSIAGQAVIQATMESALPIAQADAQTRAQFEAQNLSNRQQVAMFAAQQRASFLQQDFDQEFQSRVQNAARVADIANMNFTAEQQVALENSRAANSMNLQNLSNSQAMVMAEASALSNLDMANLNNRQQAAVQNAQNFLQMDMANLEREQQTAIFKTQQRVNSLLSDQAAENAARQFNAASENQTNQFFADLQTTVSRFNADQTNAIQQFNSGEANAMSQFNASLQEQRDQFNANNRLVVAQANAKWRQDIATLNTAAQNEAIMQAAKTSNALTANAMDEIWQRERDLMSFSWQSTENARDRNTNLLLADKQISAEQGLLAQEMSFKDQQGKGNVLGQVAAAAAPTVVEGLFSLF